MCPGNQEATSRPPKSKRSRNPPSPGPGPDTAPAARSAPAHTLMAAAPLPLRHTRRDARGGGAGGSCREGGVGRWAGTTSSGRADAGWAGRCPEQASLPSAPGRHGGAAAYGARGAYGGPDGGSWRHGGCRAPRGARHPPYRGSWYPPCRGSWSPTRSPAAPSPSAHPRARPDTVPAGRHPLPHRQHQLVLAPRLLLPAGPEPRSRIHHHRERDREREREAFPVPPPGRVLNKGG